MRNRPGNHLFYGDNLTVLRRKIPDESVDLIYLDPPFDSNANYGILFREPDGRASNAQIEVFEDTWHWNESAEDAFDQARRSGNIRAFDLPNAMRGFLGDNDMMACLAMMAEAHRSASLLSWPNRPARCAAAPPPPGCTATASTRVSRDCRS
ncbi:hypothetical protein [Sphingomonas bacterium]|uniref:hypothetical protein n=1 Tax=Sphingomonas bacterium TaxID=1895847 RepID=UPI0020C69B11|nr:hypothetical protein [Sphingomonas bacterium]